MQGPGLGAADLYAEARQALERGAWTDVLRLAGQALAADPLHSGASELVVVARRQLEVAARGEGERRQLSILFCDIVGSTTLAAELGAEAYRDVLLAVHRAAVGAVTQYEGRIAQYLGDGILAYFSYPQAHEDDPRRAMLAGLALVQRVQALGPALLERHGRAPQVRVGIDTGLVVVGSLGSGEWTTSDSVVGDPPNIAARLQGLAAPGEVLVTEATQALTEAYFDVERVGDVELRNFPSPVGVYRVLGARDLVAQSVTQAGSRGPFVGRELESAKLAAMWAAVLEGQRRDVLVTGDAGIGKSRLIEQLANLVTAGGGRRIELRCANLYRHSAFWPVRAALLRLFAPTDRAGGAALATTLPDITDGLSALGWAWDDAPGDAEHGGRGPDGLAPKLLARLIGIDVTVDLLPEALRKQTLEVVAELFDLLAQSSPVLLLVEDLHEADASTRELLAMLRARSATPALIVATSREPLAELGPWSLELGLGPLPAEAGAELVRAVRPDASTEEVSRIVAMADGVPLFVEELARTASGTDGTASALRWASPSRAVLGSRIDSLDPDSRRLASELATQGPEASYDVAAAMTDLAPATLERALQDLVSERVLVPDPVAPSATFRFRHALIREAVYESQLAGDRQGRHARCAGALIDQLEGGASVPPEIVASHLTDGGAGQQAIPWWQRAAEAAAATAANVEAVAHYQRALALLEQAPADAAVAATEFGLQLGLGLCAATTLGYGSDVVLNAFERADALGRAFGDSPALLPAVWGMWSFHLVRADHERAQALAQRCLTMAAGTTGAAGSDVRNVVGAIVGYQQFFLGDFPGASAELRLASKAAGESVLPFPQDPAIASLANLAVASWITGDIAQSDAEMTVALAEAEALVGRRAEFTRAFVFTFAAWLAQLADDAEGATRHAQRALQISVDNSFAVWLGAASLHLAGAQCASGHADVGLPMFASALDAYRKAGAELMVPYFLGRLGTARAAAGMVDAGRVDLDDAIAASERSGERFYLAELWRLRAALDSNDRPDLAYKALTVAADHAAAQGAATFEIRGLLDLCNLAHRNVTDGSGASLSAFDHAGVMHDATARLRAALARWGDRATLPEVREARALLGASAPTEPDPGRSSDVAGARPDRRSW